MAWRAGTETAYRNYQFSYNAKGWLTSATYSGTGSYSVQYQYDTMGNITSLQRYGLQDNSQYGLIDNLSYTYNGNQLVTVTDGRSVLTIAEHSTFLTVRTRMWSTNTIKMAT